MSTDTGHDHAEHMPQASTDEAGGLGLSLSTPYKHTGAAAVSASASGASGFASSVTTPEAPSDDYRSSHGQQMAPEMLTPRTPAATPLPLLDTPRTATRSRDGTRTSRHSRGDENKGGEGGGLSNQAYRLRSSHAALSTRDAALRTPISAEPPHAPSSAGAPEYKDEDEDIYGHGSVRRSLAGDLKSPAPRTGTGAGAGTGHSRLPAFGGGGGGLARPWSEGGARSSSIARLGSPPSVTAAAAAAEAQEEAGAGTPLSVPGSFTTRNRDRGGRRSMDGVPLRGFGAQFRQADRATAATGSRSHKGRMRTRTRTRTDGPRSHRHDVDVGRRRRKRRALSADMDAFNEARVKGLLHGGVAAAGPAGLYEDEDRDQRQRGGAWAGVQDEQSKDRGNRRQGGSRWGSSGGQEARRGIHGDDKGDGRRDTVHDRVWDRGGRFRGRDEQEQQREVEKERGWGGGSDFDDAGSVQSVRSRLSFRDDRVTTGRGRERRRDGGYSNRRSRSRRSRQDIGIEYGSLDLDREGAGRERRDHGRGSYVGGSRRERERESKRVMGGLGDFSEYGELDDTLNGGAYTARAGSSRHGRSSVSER